jgi:A/G-specific adenine glycosylase
VWPPVLYRKLKNSKRKEDPGGLRKLNPPLRPETVKKLVRWYRKHRRDLPWRKTKDPYRIWISEVMLQQTQVETVRPYYQKFLKAFPNVKTLASAPIDCVMKVWEGAGYYARARNLHKAAKEIVRNGGRFPESAKELIRLPGIGSYTAAAVASIAFGEAVPVIDGNVERVLARVICEKGHVKTHAAAKQRIQRAAEQIMCTAARYYAPGDVNQAMMEIGATICKPRRVDCPACPLKTDCRATNELADPTVLPKKAPTKAIPHYDVTAAIIRKRGRILITKRPSKGLLGGLWEFPGGKKESKETLEACLRREIKEELGIEIRVKDLFAKVKHSYSHFRITLYAFDCEHLSGRVQKLGVADYQWVKPQELPQFAFPKADREILNKLTNR